MPSACLLRQSAATRPDQEGAPAHLRRPSARRGSRSVRASRCRARSLPRAPRRARGPCASWTAGPARPRVCRRRNRARRETSTRARPPSSPNLTLTRRGSAWRRALASASCTMRTSSLPVLCGRVLGKPSSATSSSPYLPQAILRLRSRRTSREETNESPNASFRRDSKIAPRRPSPKTAGSRPSMRPPTPSDAPWRDWATCISCSA
jgi:hypothetical protein